MFFQIGLFLFFEDKIYHFVMWPLIAVRGFYRLLPFSKHKLQPVFLEKVLFAGLSATLSNTCCWEGFDWSVDKEVLLSDEVMYFYYLLLIIFSCLLKKLLFKIAEVSCSSYFTFILMNLVTFIAWFMFFVIFAKID